MQIRFWSATSLPMYGTSVEELHLDIDGAHYVVREGDDGPVLVDWEYEQTQAATYLQDQDEVLDCEGHESTDGPIGNVEYCDGTCR